MLTSASSAAITPPGKPARADAIVRPSVPQLRFRVFISAALDALQPSYILHPISEKSPFSPYVTELRGPEGGYGVTRHFLEHRAGDHVGVVVTMISRGLSAQGVFMEMEERSAALSR